VSRKGRVMQTAATNTEPLPKVRARSIHKQCMHTTRTTGACLPVTPTSRFVRSLTSSSICVVAAWPACVSENGPFRGVDLARPHPCRGQGLTAAAQRRRGRGCTRVRVVGDVHGPERGPRPRPRARARAGAGAGAGEVGGYGVGRAAAAVVTSDRTRDTTCLADTVVGTLRWWAPEEPRPSPPFGDGFASSHVSNFTLLVTKEMASNYEN
jgi:hypothetical protein